MTRRRTTKRSESGNGMMTSVWGPSTWHLLHTISFNYPVEPSRGDRERYRSFMLALQHVLPCGKCRDNLVRNFGQLPLTKAHLASRESFSRYVYELHELVNQMLHKRSGLTYGDVCKRYEQFRAQCGGAGEGAQEGEGGCTEPRRAHQKKRKCVLRVVQESHKMKHFFGCDHQHQHAPRRQNKTRRRRRTRRRAGAGGGV